MADWKRNFAPQGFKGLDIHIDYVRVEVLKPCPPVLEYLPTYATQHWHDSHGSLHKLETSAAGQVQEWMETVKCNGQYLYVYYTTWWLVPGTLESTDYPTNLFSWDRNNAPQADPPFKGVEVLDVILLDFWPPNEEDAEGCEIFDDSCYELPKPGDPPGHRKSIGAPGTPVCWPTRMCGVAKAGRLWFDSHGNLDVIESWPQPGLETTIIKWARIFTEECVDTCPAGQHPDGDNWKVEYAPRRVILHPGSVPVGTRVEVFDCCACCACESDCELLDDGTCVPEYVKISCDFGGHPNGICIKRVLKFNVLVGDQCSSPTITIDVTWVSGKTWEGSKTFTDNASNTRTWKATATIDCDMSGCISGWTLKLEETAFTAGGSCSGGGLTTNPYSCTTTSCTWCPVDEMCGAVTALDFCLLSNQCSSGALTFKLTE